MKTTTASRARLFTVLADGSLRPDALAQRLADEPSLAPEVFAGLDERPASVRFGCAKALLLVSGRAPRVLLPSWRRLIALLGHENKILQWSALLTLGNLAGVASRARLEALLPRLLAPLRGPVMITAANAMRSAVQVALARPELAGPVAREILLVERARYATDECRHIALGHAIQALERLLPLLERKGPALEMVRRQLDNPRPATRKKAAAFLARATRQQKRAYP